MRRIMHLPRSTGSGFTLVELLVVTAIVGIALAALLPGIQASREAARRVDCLERIRMLGGAVMEFESAWGALPPGGAISSATSTQNCDDGSPASFGISVHPCFDFRSQREGPGYSWIVLCLPFMEEQALYDQFDFSRKITTLATTPYSQSISSIICPTDGAVGPMYDGLGDSSHTGRTFAKGNYAAFLSPVHLNHHRVWPGALGGFTPGTLVGQRLSKIRDGIANTLLAADVRTLERSWDSRGAWALVFPGATILSVDLHPQSATSTAFYVPDPTYSPTSVNTPNTTTMFDQLVACAQPAYAYQQKMPCEALTYMGATTRSKHPGGTNAVALDGRAGFVADSIDPFVMACLVSTNDGQLVNLGKYLQ